MCDVAVFAGIIAGNLAGGIAGAGYVARVLNFSLVRAVAVMA